MRTFRARVRVKPSISWPVRICAPRRAQSTTLPGLARSRSTRPSEGVARGKSVMPPVMVPTLPMRAMTIWRCTGGASSRVMVAVKGSGTAFWTAATA